MERENVEIMESCFFERAGRMVVLIETRVWVWGIQVWWLKIRVCCKTVAC